MLANVWYTMLPPDPMNAGDYWLIMLSKHLLWVAVDYSLCRWPLLRIQVNLGGVNLRLGPKSHAKGNKTVLWGESNILYAVITMIIPFEASDKL